MKSYALYFISGITNKHKSYIGALKEKYIKLFITNKHLLLLRDYNIYIVLNKVENPYIK